jgi:uncharacterized protein
MCSIQIENMKRWFENSVSFACTACGKCCKSRGKTKVYINPAELTILADQFDLGVDTFTDTYTDIHRLQDGTQLRSLKSNPAKTQCIFLKDNICTVYVNRPTQCRTYPYWPDLMVGKAEWVSEQRDCEGMSFNSTSLQKPNRNNMFLNLIVHQIHNRGTGENWTYDEAMELLEESLVANPELVREFEEDFFNENGSNIGI